MSVIKRVCRTQTRVVWILIAIDFVGSDLNDVEQHSNNFDTTLYLIILSIHRKTR